MSDYLGALDDRVARYDYDDFLDVDPEPDYMDDFLDVHPEPDYMDPELEDDYGEAISQRARISFCSPRFMTPVWDQGMIDCCIAFVVSAQFGAVYAMTCGGPPIEYSKQELVDCLPILEGGTTYAFAIWYIRWYGLHLEMMYPYEEYYKLPCRCRSIGIQMKLTVALDNYWILSQDRTEIINALSRQPLMAGILVFKSFLNFQHPLKSDIELMQLYKPDENELPMTSAKGDVFGHAVLVVGFVDGDEQSFIIKNTYGKRWGMRGYAKVAAHLLFHFRYITNPLLDVFQRFRNVPLVEE